LARASRRGIPSRGYFLFLSLAALGVVFGDIGTSPLYAVQACFNGTFGVDVTPENVLGVVSLIFWSLVLVVTVKYLTFVLRADNDGEGGILALMALVHPRHARGGAAAGEPRKRRSRRTGLLIALGLFGAALLYGDGMITPAISVLSAVEGTQLVEPALGDVVLPITVVILIGLFALQRRGTAGVGKLFGPVMILWFLTLAALGVRGILTAPQVLLAIDPVHAFRLFHASGPRGFLVLGAVFLCVTGAEALYADMGHFGRGPIRFTWLSLVLPALLLNYFGQGALLLQNPGAHDNPFYRLAPGWALVPLIVLATGATVIASQAIISGAFSLTAQAVQLGYSPRMEIRHTSEREIGQIYVPQVNWALMVATIFLVTYFKTSNSLAAAYGIAVTSTMLITTVLFGEVARERWGWSRTLVELLMALFLIVDLAFFGANLLKIVEGGWLPLAVAAGVFIVMTTWRRGRRILGQHMRSTSVPLEKFLEDIARRPPTRVRGNAVYMTGNGRVAPPALIKNLEHNRVLHFQVALLSIVTEDVPHVPVEDRVSYEPLEGGFYRVAARYGFMDEPDATEVLALLREKGLDLPLQDTTFFLGRERVIATARLDMPFWRERLFSFMSRNAQQATAYFRIPPDRVIEVGSQVEI
jgi:KUP system potassium uptake protein